MKMQVVEKSALVVAVVRIRRLEYSSGRIRRRYTKTAAENCSRTVVHACLGPVAVDVFRRFPEIPETSLKL